MNADTETTTTLPWWSMAWLPLAIPVGYVVLFWSRAQLEPVWLLRPLLVVVLAGTVLLQVAPRSREA